MTCDMYRVGILSVCRYRDPASRGTRRQGCGASAGVWPRCSPLLPPRRRPPAFLPLACDSTTPPRAKCRLVASAYPQSHLLHECQQAVYQLSTCTPIPPIRLITGATRTTTISSFPFRSERAKPDVRSPWRPQEHLTIQPGQATAGMRSPVHAALF